MRLRANAFSAIVAVAGFGLAPPAHAAALPECAGAVEVDHAHIVRIEKNGALIFHDGRAAHLEGIRLPQGAADRAPQYLAEQALATLSQLVIDQDVTLTAVPPKEDRYDRIRAQAFLGGDWVQVALLKRGLARVDIAPDRLECAAELYAAEGEARAKHTGLWIIGAYAIQTPQAVRGDVGTFRVVEGKVLSTNTADGRCFLNFGADWPGDFSAVIAEDDMRRFRIIGVDPRAYAGKTVRVRGIVQSASGPWIAVANPMQVEVVGY